MDKDREKAARKTNLSSPRSGSNVNSSGIMNTPRGTKV